MIFALFFLLMSDLLWAKDCPKLYDASFRKLHSDQIIQLCDLVAGHPVLLVNTASHCGFTKQFKALEDLHQRYEKQGLKVIGFSSNDFKQEAKKESESAKICFVNFGVTFPMFAPVPVRGADAIPLYKEVSKQAGRSPKWNFYKYLIDAKGNVIDGWSPFTKPDDPELIDAIQKVLPKPMLGMHSQGQQANHPMKEKV